jgi:lipopolysaccharide/colanic/teichoic acid biosynthesis glycosyltransferase
MYRGEEREILTVRPGITDWASVWNSDEGAVLAGAQDPDKAYEELIRPTKLRLQLKYVRERKLFTDVKLVIYTLLKIVRKGWVPRELAKYPRPDARRTPPPPES